MSKVLLSSREVAAVSYDPAQALLEVELRKGQTYAIRDVPPVVYETLIGSQSPGTYYHLHIRKGDYDIRRVR